ncbi:endoglucanase [Anaerobacterium chartisolvens]|uniref:Endoglucanase n=1 Tax=Anaerobacterium chartisolvens TaxID=1297424 RepID=A0A369B751_9FIRM|nr:M42 family metallopeptidase [Anaerobacterium chartisolvens]RCX16376.1 endoglucanase [Anaerobacterium chartisolvens]
MFNLVNKLTKAFGVSGSEGGIRDAIIEEIKDSVDEITTDVLGNLIALKKGKGNGKKIMLAAHMDEIGVMATYIDDKGFVRFSNIGGVSPSCSVGQRVVFQNGVRGSVFYEEKLQDLRSLKLSKMYIDIGAGTREDAQKMIAIGSVACFEGAAVMQNGMITSKALDDRSGCAVLVSTIRALPETDNELYFVFTVQEELGLRGARTAAYQIQPDLAVAVDVTLTGDTPGCNPMEVKCGSGPAIKIKDSSIICHPQVRSLLEDTAKKLNIPYQLEILDRGGNDSGAIHITAGGIPAGTLSIPCRYVHSPCETVSLSDMEQAVRILTCAVT